MKILKLTRHNLRKYFHDLMDTKLFLKNKFNLHLTFLSSNHLKLSMMLLETKCLFFSLNINKNYSMFCLLHNHFYGLSTIPSLWVFCFKKDYRLLLHLTCKKKRKNKKLEKWMYRCKLTKINSLFFLGLLLDAPFCLKHFAFCCCRTDFTFLKELSKEE